MTQRITHVDVWFIGTLGCRRFCTPAPRRHGRRRTRYSLSGEDDGWVSPCQHLLLARGGGYQGLVALSDVGVMLWACPSICLHLEDGLRPGRALRPDTEAEDRRDLGRGQASPGSSDPQSQSQCGGDLKKMQTYRVMCMGLVNSTKKWYFYI